VEHVQQEHGAGWVQALQTVDRPYAFIKFDKTIQRLRKDYSDPNSRQSTSKLNTDLADVTNIMKRNIQDVLDRGERLNNVSDQSSRLVNDSKNFHSGAKQLNRLAWMRKWAPVAIGSLLVTFFFYLRFYIL
jgi:vesicle transport protein SEC22